MALYKNGVQVNEANNVEPPPEPTGITYIGRFLNNFNFKGTIDNVMIFNRALTAEEIEILHNGGSGTETIPAGSPQAVYIANRWSFDVTGDFEVKADFHYSGISDRDGWVGINIENDEDNYVSISAGCDNNEPYFYYEKVVDGNPASGQEVRGSDDGTLYISYDAIADELYISSTGYGEPNAWQTISGLLQGQWTSEPVYVVIGGGSDGAVLDGSGEAYLDNFEVGTATLLGWPVATDLDGDGLIGWGDVAEISEHWLEIGQGIKGDINNDETVNFPDFAELALEWQAQ